MISVRLEPADGEPAAPALPGQFLTVRLRPDPAAPALLRTYSLSGTPNTASYRISVKREPHGAGSGYLHDRLRVGDVIEAGAPRGEFVLRARHSPGGAAQRRRRRDARARDAPRPGGRALAAAGVVAARALATAPSTRSRRRSANCSRQLPDAHRIVCYSRPGPGDTGFDVTGRLTADVIDAGGVPTAEADFYVCGPGPFMHDIAGALTARGVPPDRVAMEVFGPGESSTPGIVGAQVRPPHPPPGEPGPGPPISFSRSNLSVDVGSVVREPARVRRGLRRPGQVVVPDRRLPHVRDRARQRRGQLRGPTRSSRPSPGRALICCSRPAGEIVLDL